jgi:hypothetical protein
VQQVLGDYHEAVDRFDPTGQWARDIRQELASSLALEELDDDCLLHYRLMSYLRFLEREKGRVEQYPHQLRAIATAEALDTPVRTGVRANLTQWPPRVAWLELLHPFAAAPDAARIRTLRGHTRQVNAVSWSRDGKRIMSASDDATSDDATLIVWDAESGRPRSPRGTAPRAHKGCERSVVKPGWKVGRLGGLGPHLDCVGRGEWSAHRQTTPRARGRADFDIVEPGRDAVRLGR